MMLNEVKRSPFTEVTKVQKWLRKTHVMFQSAWKNALGWLARPSTLRELASAFSKSPTLRPDSPSTTASTIELSIEFTYWFNGSLRFKVSSQPKH